ncbi:MAG: flagellar biosynthetic protein FliR [Cycloclasticus pugetii]|uniref:Flagellar biosynthetic protein FliR n=2 Tax=Piscirickettsiaceae TaxID=135616 RepID=S5T645_9GAMM|nr:flagellar biosynthetic protein FliR [uncultured Cycloclasticus sp.]AGS39256.1 Flagellar biosynthesis protein FliR [Cycloclasticus zancles 78-ME]
MVYSEQQIMAWASSFFWPLLRISAMFIAIPVFSGRFVDNKILVGAALMVTFFTLPLLPEHRAIDVLSHEGIMTGLQQLLIGLSVGFVLQLVFSAIIFAGQGIAYSMGLGFASMMDPTTGVSVPVVSQFYLVLATLLFLTLGGHLVLIEMLIDSFNTLPIGDIGMERSDIWSIIAWSSRIFSAGLLMALPAIVSLLMVNIAFGVVTRAAPQLNIFAVGFPITLILGTLLMWVTLTSVLGNFTNLLAESYGVIGDFLRIRR